MKLTELTDEEKRKIHEASLEVCNLLHEEVSKGDLCLNDGNTERPCMVQEPQETEKENTKMEATYSIEYGEPTDKQKEKCPSTVCNLNITLFMGGQAVGNMSGFQVRERKDGKHWIKGPGFPTDNGWFNLYGFSKKMKNTIIKAALSKAKAGKLVGRYAHRFEMRPKRKS